jgi:hypothetical protein
VLGAGHQQRELGEPVMTSPTSELSVWRTGFTPMTSTCSAWVPTSRLILIRATCPTSSVTAFVTLVFIPAASAFTT